MYIKETNKGKRTETRRKEHSLLFPLSAPFGSCTQDTTFLCAFLEVEVSREFLEEETYQPPIPKAVYETAKLKGWSEGSYVFHDKLLMFYKSIMAFLIDAVF